MSELCLRNRDSWSPLLAEQVDATCDRFEGAWKVAAATIERPRIEDYLGAVADEERLVLLSELVLVDAYYRRRHGENPQPADYARRFPSLDPDLLADAVVKRATESVECGAPNVPRSTLSASAFEPPAIPGYEILGLLGRGGMGVIYQAWQVGLKRRVALKMIRDQAVATAQELARFATEAEAVARLQHPNIMQIYEIGEHGGRPFFSLELLTGGSLDKKLAGAPLPAAPAARLVESVARAVHYAHQHGILHRDLKPANILLTAEGLPKIADFGLAKLSAEGAGQTQSGTTLGTPSYMAPEQARGQTKEIGPAVDIYSLGAILYETLTGRPPFRAETPLETMRQVQAEEAVSVVRLQPKVPRDLNTICLKCLQKEPRKRYASAEALAEDLRRFLAGEPIQAQPIRMGERALKWAKRRPALAALVSVSIAAVLSLLLGGVSFTFLVMREKAQTDAARDELERTLYYQRVALAEREWKENKLTRVEQLLDACPVRLRGWEWHYVKRLRLQGLPPLRHPTHSTAVFSAVFSPDGRWIASGSQDGKITVWDGTTGQYLFDFQAHELHVHSVTFSPDGRLLATAGWDKTVKVWDFDRQRARAENALLLTLTEHTDRAQSVAFSPDSQHLASAGADKTVRVWEMASGRQILVLSEHTGVVRCVAYSPDGQGLASASDTSVKIWDAATGREKLTLSRHSAPVVSVTFSRDGRWLASATEDITTKGDCELKIWDAQAGTEALTLHDPITGVNSVMFSPDGRRLPSGGFDGNVKLWDLATGQEALVLRGHTGGVRSVAFSRDGNRIVSASLDCDVRVWNATPLEAEARQEVGSLIGHEGGVHSVAFSPDGRHLASAGADATVRFWDFMHGLGGIPNPPIHTLPGHKSKVWQVYNVAFSSNGQLLAAAGEGGPQGGWLKVWDTTSWKELRPIANASSPVAFSPDGRYLVAGGGQVGTDFPVKVWELATGRELHTLKGHIWAVHDVAFAPHADVPLLASASADGTVRIWDVIRGTEIHKLEWDTGGVRCLAFSPDGHLVASGGMGRVIRIWDTRSWQRIYELPDLTGCIHSVVFHPKDSRVLAWTSTAGTVKVWDSVTKEIRALHGHTGAVESVAFSPGGEWLASASLDGTVKIWKVPPLPE